MDALCNKKKLNIVIFDRIYNMQYQNTVIYILLNIETKQRPE